MQKNRSVLIVSYYFYPFLDVGAKRPSELAIFLAGKGYNVTVIASRRDELCHKDVTLLEHLDNVRVIYVFDPPRILNKLWALVSRFVKRNEASSMSSVATTQPGQNRIDEPLSLAQNLTSRVRQSVKRYLLSLQAVFDAKKTWLVLVLFAVAMERVRKKSDVVITSSPINVAHMAGLFAKAINHSYWIMDVRDPLDQPEATLDITKSGLRETLESMNEKIASFNADKIICASLGIENLTKVAYPTLSNIITIYNGYDGDFKRFEQRADQSQCFTMVYAGQLYLHRNPFPLIDAIDMLYRKGNIEVGKFEMLFFGDCESWNGRSLRDYIVDKGLGELVKLKGYVDKSRLSEELNNASILVNFAQNQPAQLPAKTFEYLATGKMSLVFTEGDSDTARIIQETKSGYIVNSDALETEKTLMDLYVAHTSERSTYNSRFDLAQKYSRSQQNSQYLGVIESLFVDEAK